MEKNSKPVPDVRCLKYHGTREKPDIKIFVSHRIDLDSETIHNPLYIPVRCGAVYDEREGVTMLGDDTGDNISKKRESYCELTVQYWAWKNIKADYYGLCHYRRYLSFEEDESREKDAFNHITERFMDEDAVQNNKLTESEMRSTIEKYDIISSVPMNLDEVLDNVTVHDSLKLNRNTYDISAIDLFLKILKRKFPEYSEAAEQYMKGTEWRAWNCFIMKKDLFDRYCFVLFSVLDVVEKKLVTSRYNQEQMRQFGYMGEIWGGIFYLYLKDDPSVKKKTLPIVKFGHTEKQVKLRPVYSSCEVAVTAASSDEYAPFLCVLLQSIVHNSTKTYNYDIVILSNNISSRNKKMISGLIKENISIRFFEIASYLGNREFYTRDHVTVMTYVRLAVLDIFKHYSKVIYLDCDMIVNRDIAELYNTDVSRYYVAAVRDTVMAGWSNDPQNEQYAYNRDTLKIKRIRDYFNGGVLLFNISLMRKKYSADDLLEMASTTQWKWFDQDVLNIVCQGKTYFLDQKWNFMAHVYDVPQQTAEFFAPYPMYKKYKESAEEPWIVHYAGRVIPCFAPSVELAYMFWAYARMTPYYELIISAMITTQISISMSRLLPAPTLDTRTAARREVDSLLPPGTKRRRLLNFFFPDKSRRWRLLKRIYFIFKPQNRPLNG